MSNHPRQPLSFDELVALVERAGELGCADERQNDERQSEETQSDERPNAQSRKIQSENMQLPAGLLAAIEAQIPSALGARSGTRPQPTPWRPALVRPPVRWLALAAAVLLALSAALLLYGRRVSTGADAAGTRASADSATEPPGLDSAARVAGVAETQPLGTPNLGTRLAQGPSAGTIDGEPTRVGATNVDTADPGRTGRNQEEPDPSEPHSAAPATSSNGPASDSGASGRSSERGPSSRPPADSPLSPITAARSRHAAPRSSIDPWLSSFPLQVASESYLRARRALANERLPSPGSVRVEEFLNAFDYGDTQPSDGDFELTAEGAPSPFDDRLHLLRFGISARALDPSARSPIHLILVVETPSSRSGQRNYELMRPALELLFEQLEPSDSVALVVFGATGRTLVRPTSDFDDIRGRLRQAFAFAIPGGSADPEEGVRLGYELALQSFDPSKTNRVVLCYDGRSPIEGAVTVPLRRKIEEARSRGIGFSAVGFDTGPDAAGGAEVGAIEELATLGGGPSDYVHTPRQASHRLVEALLDRRQLVAREALARVRFDREKVRRFRLLASSNPAAAGAGGEHVRDTELGTTELGAGASVTALYELELARPVAIGESLATLSLRYVAPDTGVVHETSYRVLGRDLAATWQNAPPSLRLSTVVAELAASLGEGHLLPVRPDTLHQQSQQLLLDYPQRGDVRELADLVASSQRLRSESRPPGR